MTEDELLVNYPVLFHMAESGTWPSIQRHGLLSTCALLDLFEIRGAERHAIEALRRPRSVTIKHERLGNAVVRDQKPMDDKGLTRALDGCGLSPQDWYRLLNGRVFFWVTKERLMTLLNADLYRDNTQLVLTIDTAQLLKAHAGEVTLSPINSGCTKPYPHPRGANTFLPIAEFPFSERRKTRKLGSAVVELTVDYAVRKIADFVIRAEHWRGNERLETLFSSPQALGCRSRRPNNPHLH